MDIHLRLGEYVALLTAISAIIFPQLQIFSIHRQLTLAAFHEEISIVSTVGKIFLDAPELRPFFYDGADMDDTDPRSDHAKVVAEAICDAFALLILSWKRSTNISSTRPGQERWIQDIYASSPLLRRWIARNEEWYPKEMIRFLERRCGYRRRR
jgi:hypothetical protein